MKTTPAISTNKVAKSDTSSAVFSNDNRYGCRRVCSESDKSSNDEHLQKRAATQ